MLRSPSTTRCRATWAQGTKADSSYSAPAPPGTSWRMAHSVPDLSPKRASVARSVPQRAFGELPGCGGEGGRDPHRQARRRRPVRGRRPGGHGRASSAVRIKPPGGRCPPKPVQIEPFAGARRADGQGRAVGTRGGDARWGRGGAGLVGRTTPDSTEPRDPHNRGVPSPWGVRIGRSPCGRPDAAKTDQMNSVVPDS